MHAPRYFRKRDALDASGAWAAGSRVYHSAREATEALTEARGYLDTHPAIGFQAHAIRQQAAQIDRKLRRAAQTIAPKMGLAWFGSSPVPGNTASAQTPSAPGRWPALASTSH